jgi:hypothetical protein
VFTGGFKSSVVEKIKKCFRCSKGKPRPLGKQSDNNMAMITETTRQKDTWLKKPTQNNRSGVGLLPKRAQDKKVLILELEQLLIYRPASSEGGVSSEVWVRPDWTFFYEEVSRAYELVIWTLLYKEDAVELINLIDPHKYIQGRLFGQDCISRRLSSGGEFLVKSLEGLGCDPRNTIFLDVVSSNKINPLSVSEHPNNSFIMSPFVGAEDDSGLGDLVKPLLEIGKKKDVRCVTANIEQYSKRIKELIDMKKLKVPDDEVEKRQHVRVQDYQNNSLSIIDRKNKFLPKGNLYGFLKDQMDWSPTKRGRTPKAAFATVVESRKGGVMEGFSSYRGIHNNKQPTKEEMGPSNQSIDTGGGYHLQERSIPEGEKPSLNLEISKMEEYRKERSRRSSDKRLKALVSIRKNSNHLNTSGRSDGEKPRDYKQESIITEAEHYIQKHVELEELPKDLLPQDNQNYVFRKYYERVNQQNEATRLKASLLEYISKQI